MKSVLIAEDDVLVLEFLCDFFTTFTQIEIVGTTADPAEALDLASRLQPDLVLADLQLDPLAEPLKPSQFHELCTETKVVVFTGNCEPPSVRKAMEAGADAYLVKSDGLAGLNAALEALKNDKPFISSSLSHHIDLQAIATLKVA